MENKWEAALKEYIKNILNHARQHEYGIETAKSWLFGAIDFCFCADLINMDTYNKLMDEFVFVEQSHRKEEYRECTSEKLQQKR